MKTTTFIILQIMILTHTYAQDMPNPSDTIFAIKEIQIIASQRPTIDLVKLNIPIQYLPLTIQTLSNQQLEARSINKIEDATRFLPNVRTRTTYGSFQQIQVRGFDYTPITIDGVRDERTSINNSAPLADLSTVQTIELLKGPASVLYGHSAVGGIINLKRKAPTHYNFVNTQFTYGTWDTKRAMLDMGGKLITTINYRAVINWSQAQGYRNTNDQRLTTYLALTTPLANHQQLDIRAGINQDHYGTDIGLPPLMTNDIYNSDGSKYLSKGDALPRLNPRSRYNNQSDFLKNHSSNLSIKYTNKITPTLTLENRLAYNYDNIDYFCTEELSYPQSDQPIYKHYYHKGQTKQYISLDTVQINNPLRFAYTVHTLNEQIEIAGNHTFDNSIKYNYLAGYNLVYFHRNTYRGYGGGYPLSELIQGPGLYSKVPVYNPHSMGYMQALFSGGTATRNITNSIYLQNLVELSDQLKLMLAGRFDNFYFKTATGKINKSPKRQYDQLLPYHHTTTSALTYRIGAVYLPTQDLSLYTSLANFFMPYRDIVNTQTTIYINTQGQRYYPQSGEEAFKAQKGYQAEIGTRYTINPLLQATASIFYIRKNNEKKTINSNYIESNTTKTVVAQIGTTESKGLDLELTLAPIPQARFAIAYGYTDAKITKLGIDTQNLITEGYLDPTINLNQGTKLAGVPKNTLSAIADYTHTKGLLKGLGINLTITYTDHAYRDLNKSIIYPSYWLTDISTSYNVGNGIQLRLNVNNLFNHHYYNQSLNTQIVPANPIHCLFTISYKNI